MKSRVSVNFAAVTWLNMIASGIRPLLLAEICWRVLAFVPPSCEHCVTFKSLWLNET
jgi:hypothetical protein